MIVRAFEVRAHNRYLVCDLAINLDKELQNLQKDGWNIISVTANGVKEYYDPDHFNSRLYKIVASKNEKK